MNARAGVIAAVLVGLVAMAAPAHAATWDHAAWGWTQPAGPKVSFQWGEPFGPVQLNDRWSVEDCDGDAPFICFSSTTGASGSAELLTYPLSSHRRLQRDLEEGGRQYALRRWAYSHYRTFRDDRTDCREGYTFHPFRPKPATVAGREGIRAGFAVKDAAGTVVERSVTFATVTKTKVVIVGVEGLNKRSCLPILGPTFTPSGLKRMGPYVARMAATGKLPARG
jgi:hypothetical protein